MIKGSELARSGDPMPARQMLTNVFALLGSAGGWALHLNLTYFLVQPVCVMGGEWTLHASGVVSLLIVLASLGVSIGILTENAVPFRENVEGLDGWKAFVGLYGIASAAIFALAIIAQWSTVFVIDACEMM